jgi:hypothetical protein
MTLVGILHTNPSIPNSVLEVQDLQAVLACDRITYTDRLGNWHTSDVERRIFDATATHEYPSYRIVVSG